MLPAQARAPGTPLPILCFDLDGTLLDSAGRIHPRDAELLTHPHPAALFIPATGRSLDSVRQTFGENGLFTSGPIPLPLVLQNGSLLYLPGELEAAYLPFSAEAQAALLELTAQFPQVVFFCLGRAAVYQLNSSEYGLRAARRYKFAVRDFDSRAREVEFSKIMGLSPDPAALEAFARAARLGVEGAYSMPSIYELNAPGVSKAGGVRRLLNHLGRAGEPFNAAGDGENDRRLLQAAALAFAPTSAQDAIRQIASHLVDVPLTGLLEPMLAALPAQDT